MAKRVAIIGAGEAGLTSIKNALDAGFEPTAYEISSWLGGMWYYTEDENRFVAPKSTIFNTSKHYSCYSDFPIPKEMPNYLTMDNFQRYLESYAEKFNLTRRIRFNCKVLKVEKSKDYEDTGRWEIHSMKTDDGGKGNVCVEEYDYVMVCTGVNGKPFLPKIAGIEEYTGRKIHSISYKTFTPFEGRRVLVVGLGNTAADIACELSRHAKQVYISTRSGTYVIPRMATGGIPIDFSLIKRTVHLIPKFILNWITLRTLRSRNFSNLGLEPTNSQSVSFVLINDELPHRIVTGTLIVKDEVVGFKGKRVYFKDGTELDDIDDVIFATGYDVYLPFLTESVFNPDKASSGHHFYKSVFPVDLPHPTLAAVGFFRARGSVIPLMEMQARWALQVFKGEVTLPSTELMRKEVLDRRLSTYKQVKKGGTTSGLLLTEGIIGYLDNIGSLIGVKPNLWKLLFQDPKLAMKCFFGAAVPAQYRLMGPGAWSGAKQVIEEVEESRLVPLTTRKINNPQTSSSSSFKWIVLSVLILLIGVVIFYK